jgi:endonuclease YncB( thermonuclease family)
MHILVVAIAATLLARPTSEPTAVRRAVEATTQVHVYYPGSAGGIYPPPTGRIVGSARAVDGDTIDLMGHRIRLYGVDAPEAGQFCLAATQPYPCGEKATRALADLIRGRTVRCEAAGVDRYDRTVARCRIDGSNVDINSWLVSEGLAVAYYHYSWEYIVEETRARIARRGLWAGTFQMPSEYRAEHRHEDPHTPWASRPVH